MVLRAVPLLLSTLLLCSCAIGPTVARTELDPADGWKLLPRPCPLLRGTRQMDCGPESIAAVFGYWGKAADVAALERELYDPALDGTLPTKIPPVVRLRGLVIDLEARRGFNPVREAIDRERPLLILVTRDGQYHYFVVAGYNDRLRKVLCEDYRDRLLVLSYETLDALWKPQEYWAGTIYPPDLDRKLDDAEGFEEAGRLDEALAIFREVLAADATNARAHRGAGHCVLQLGGEGSDAKALDHFSRALKGYPDDPRLLNNLSHLLVAGKRDLVRALELAGKAVDLARAEVKELEEASRKSPSKMAEFRERIDAVNYQLASYYGTLGQARRACGDAPGAIQAWTASVALIPLDEPDRRAGRRRDVGLAYRELGQAESAREQLVEALREAQDPALRAELEGLLK